MINFESIMYRIGNIMVWFLIDFSFVFFFVYKEYLFIRIVMWFGEILELGWI